MDYKSMTNEELKEEFIKWFGKEKWEEEEPEAWESVQERMESNSRPCYNENVVRKHVLSGLMKCPKCGGTLFGTRNSWTIKGTNDTYDNSYYRCRNAYHQTGHPCDYKLRLDAKDAEAFVIKTIIDQISYNTFADRLRKEYSTEINTNKYDAELNEYKKKLELVNQTKLSLEKEIDYMPLETPHREAKLKRLNERYDLMYDEIAEIEEKIEAITKVIKGKKNAHKDLNEAIEMFENIKILLEEAASDEDKQEILKRIISSIHFDEEGKMRTIKIKVRVGEAPESEAALLDTKDENVHEWDINLEGETVSFITYDRAKKVHNRPRKPRVKEAKSIHKREVTPKEPKPRVTFEEINGELIEIHNYEKSRHIVKKRAEHYNRKQATYAQIKEYILNKYNT